jgi:adenylyltransferase/sulfurtransferase
MLSQEELARYSRHLQLGAIGVGGQEKLASARVLVVGMGGLGCPAALYLAAAGVGTLGIADFDRVEEHNLQRQVLYNGASVGQPKVPAAAARLRASNPHIRVVEHPEGVTAGNALALFSPYDLVVDCTDNFASRYLNGDAAVLCHKPLVYGSVLQFEGQVTVFDTPRGGPCHRCLYPQPPPAGAVPPCSDAGVLGAVCGVVGSLQALEAVKWIVGAGEHLRGRVLVIDALASRFHSFSVARNPDCPACGDHPVLRELVQETCAGPCARPSGPTAEVPLEISVEEARGLLDAKPAGAVLIDVREPYELAICSIAGAEHIPLRDLPRRLSDIPGDRHLLMLCHHGSRSRNATEYLRAQGIPAVTNVAGGIDAWARRIDPSLARY